nr:MAG TPA: hypothetical protein [Caudoviricetes sp.]
MMFLGIFLSYQQHLVTTQYINFPIVCSTPHQTEHSLANHIYLTSIHHRMYRLRSIHVSFVV